MDRGADGLSARLDAALAASDGRALVGLYLEAASRGAEGEAGFFLTHAWVHALETGDARAVEIADRLAGMGRL